MKTRFAFTLLLFLLLPLTAEAARKKQPLSIEVSPRVAGLPLVTLTASDAHLGDIAPQLAKKLGTTVDVSAAAQNHEVTTVLHRQPLDLALRELAPQAWIDGILSGRTGEIRILTVHLRSAGEAVPVLDELRKATSEIVMFTGDTEDATLDPLAGQLEVTYRNGKLHVFAKRQPLSVVVARIAEEIGIPVELIGDSREMIDASVTDASFEQAMSALTPSVKLYFRRDLATMAMTPVRFVLEEPSPVTTPTP